MSAQSRHAKVVAIFKLFDSNEDGGLNQAEMAELVRKVNPSVRFSEDQIGTILEEVFKTYSDFIEAGRGLTLAGLKRTYDDGAGDVDRDFDALGLSFPDGADLGDSSVVATASAAAAASASAAMALSTDEPRFESTKRLIKKLRAAMDAALKRAQVENITWQQALEKDLLALRHEADTRLGDKDEAFDGHMAMGYTLFKAKAATSTSDDWLYDEALNSYQRANPIQPDNPLLHFRMGNCLFHQALLKESIYDSSANRSMIETPDFRSPTAEYELALECARKSPTHWKPLQHKIFINLGIALEKQGLILGAADAYREAVIVEPSSAKANKLYGGAKLGLGKPELEEAVIFLRKATELDPGMVSAFTDLGAAESHLGNTDSANQAFKEALRLSNETDFDALNNYAKSLMDQGEMSAAARNYSKAIKLHPSCWQTHTNLASCLIAQGKFDEADAQLHQASALEDRIEFYDMRKNMRKLYPTLATKAALSRKQSTQAVPAAALPEFSRHDKETTPPADLRVALMLRRFQNVTRLHRVPVSQLRKELSASNLTASATSKIVRKAKIERILRKESLLGSVPVNVFSTIIMALNEKLLNLMDASKTGNVDLALFIATIAPFCQGSEQERKELAFQALMWRSGKVTISAHDMEEYLLLLKAISKDPLGESLEEAESKPLPPELNLQMFSEIFEDRESNGFPYLPIFAKLEKYDKVCKVPPFTQICCAPS
eukprot:scaffold2542_cov325-Prasinococcus_capsulatus_cf.AAC.7